MMKTNKEKISVDTSFSDYARKNLEVIHGYSEKHNQLLKRNHSLALLDLIEEHIDEVRQLHARKDKHYLVETGDIVIMCLGLIKEAGISPDEILERCYERFHKKLPQLIENIKASKGEERLS